MCMVRTKSSMFASCSGVAWTTRSGPSSINCQVVVGDETGDLDDGVARRVEPRHLQIDPGQHARGMLPATPDGGRLAQAL